MLACTAHALYNVPQMHDWFDQADDGINLMLDFPALRGINVYLMLAYGSHSPDDADQMDVWSTQAGEWLPLMGINGML